MSEKPEQKPAVGLDSTAAAVLDGTTARDAELPDASKHAPGTVLAGYVIESFIAEGGFGSVYRARHDRHGAVALKVSHVAVSKLSTERLALQQNELEALLQLRHPSLVRVLDHGALDDGRTYLALELIEGESLHHYMERRGRVDVIEALGLVRRIAEGIAHCHEAKILHLDLTPKNVIVVDAYAPELKIVDFGVAAFAENWLDVERRPAAGTPLYMAPELVSDQPQIGGHCDVYALGLILYELLTGRFPFGATSTWDLFLKKLRGEMLPVTAHVPEIPDAVAKTVHALLEPDPAKRGFTAASLGVHLKQLYFEILRGGDTGAGDASTSRPIRTQVSVEPHTAPLVGRDDELGALLARAEGALHDGDNGWAVVISGDPGIGKSRLLAELTHRLRLGRFAAGYGRCRAHGNLISYASWRECLGQLEQVVAKARGPHADAARADLHELLADPAVADLCVLVPELESMLLAADTTAETAPPSADVGSKRVSQAVMRLLTTICRHFPTAIVLEDLHWADQGSMDILGALVAQELPPGLLVLCTARPEAELPLGPALDRLRLQPLDEARSAALLRALAGELSPSVIAELTAAIPLLRMGNPLVDTQVILHLKREGLLEVGDDGKIVMSDRFDRGYEPPTTVASVLERRMQHIPERARDVLGIASLIGRQFRVTDLRLVAAPELDAAAVDDAVSEAIDLSLLHAGLGEVGFVHDMIREHLETNVPAERRPELHARIARTLRERDTPAATLAYHLDQAGDRAAAAAKYVEGGIEADRVHDLVGSSKNLRRALALFLELPPSPARDRALASTASELARITCLLGKTHEPLEHLDRVQQSMQSPPEDALVMLHSAYARVYYAQGNFDLAMDYSQRSLAVHDPALAPYQCVPANMLGRALCAGGHFGPSIDVLYRGCELARETHDLVELSHSAGLLGTALAFVGRFADSREQIAESSRIAEQLNNPARRLGVCLYQTMLFEAAGQWDDGVRTSAHLLAQAEELSMSGLYLYLGTMMAGRHHFHVGELSRARHLLRNAINLSTIFSIKTCRSWAHAYLGDVYFVENRVEDAQRCYATGLELAREGKGDGHGVPLALIGMAHASAALGIDVAQVRALADESFAAFEAASNVTGLATALLRYTEAIAVRDELGDAAPFEARLERVLEQIGAPRCEFWPSAPVSATQAERAMPAPEYWKHRTGTQSDAGEKLDATRTATGSLLLNLSTVEGFIPGFIGRQP